MTLTERVKRLEADNRLLLANLKLLVDAHNKHVHNIEWPQVVTVVLGPQVTPANIKGQ